MQDIKVRKGVKMRILITGGPTNEYIDEVMKITNMSKGSLSKSLANDLARRGHEVLLLLNDGVNPDNIDKSVKVELMDDADSLYRALERASAIKFDVLVHAAAVGDYKADFCFSMESLADFIFKNKSLADDKETLYRALISDSSYHIDNDSKMSSGMDDLCVKMSLTPKIISHLRKMFGNETTIIGCKLLENVPEHELVEAARGLIEKNDVDYILAHDLSKLRDGDPTRTLVKKDSGQIEYLNTHEDIINFIDSIKRR